MTVRKTAIAIGRFTCLSTDTKPTQSAYKAGTQIYDVPHGSTIFETDTGILYFTADGETWVVKDAASVWSTPEGSSLINETLASLQVAIVTDEFAKGMTDLYGILDELLLELRRANRIAELTLGQEVAR